MIYLVDKYGRTKALAHGHRMIATIDFLLKYEKELLEARIVITERGWLKSEDFLLFEAFAKLKFDRRRGFDFKDVVKYVERAKRPN